jgi:hypothetical protein
MITCSFGLSQRGLQHQVHSPAHMPRVRNELSVGAYESGLVMDCWYSGAKGEKC